MRKVQQSMPNMHLSIDFLLLDVFDWLSLLKQQLRLYLPSRLLFQHNGLSPMLLALPKLL